LKTGNLEMKLIHALLIIFTVSGCASQKIIIDKEGVDMSKYRQDLETCREYAEEVESGSELAQGAVGGAVIGGAVGAILGGRRTAEKLAGVGAVTGAARGGSSASAEKSQVIKNCLRGRGYRVLN
jgi:outer membrane lipoprotein SlyB